MIEGGQLTLDVFIGKHGRLDFAVDRAIRQHVPCPSRFPLGPACPQCGAPTRQRTGKSGLFWSCSRYPTARHAAGGNRHVQAWCLASTPYQWRWPQRRLTAPFPVSHAAIGGVACVPMPCGTPQRNAFLLRVRVRPAPAAGPSKVASPRTAPRAFSSSAFLPPLRRVPDGLACASHPGDLRGQRYSVPVPAGAKTGSLCARMRQTMPAPATTWAGCDCWMSRRF